jgi:hypothetical protein
MVTSTCLGMALAAEPAEPDVMERPPRPANKRLIGKLVLWRMAFVSHIIVALVLGGFYWGEKQGFDLATRRAEAFNTLVACQITYFITWWVFAGWGEGQWGWGLEGKVEGGVRGEMHGTGPVAALASARAPSSRPRARPEPLPPAAASSSAPPSTTACSWATPWPTQQSSSPWPSRSVGVGSIPLSGARAAASSHTRDPSPRLGN